MVISWVFGYQSLFESVAIPWGVFRDFFATRVQQFKQK